MGFESLQISEPLKKALSSSVRSGRFPHAAILEDEDGERLMPADRHLNGQGDEALRIVGGGGAHELSASGAVFPEYLHDIVNAAVLNAYEQGDVARA